MVRPVWFDYLEMSLKPDWSPPEENAIDWTFLCELDSIGQTHGFGFITRRNSQCTSDQNQTMQSKELSSDLLI